MSILISSTIITYDLTVIQNFLEKLVTEHVWREGGHLLHLSATFQGCSIIYFDGMFKLVKLGYLE